MGHNNTFPEILLTTRCPCNHVSPRGAFCSACWRLSYITFTMTRASLILTSRPKGHEQCKHLASVFPYFGRIDMVCASPIRRAIQTAQITMDPFLQSGKKTILALPLAQEATDKPANTPSSIGRLQEEYGHIVNFERCMEDHRKDYDSKRGKWAPDASSLEARARELRLSS